MIFGQATSQFLDDPNRRKYVIYETVNLQSRKTAGNKREPNATSKNRTIGSPCTVPLVSDVKPKVQGEVNSILKAFGLVPPTRSGCNFDHYSIFLDYCIVFGKVFLYSSGEA